MPALLLPTTKKLPRNKPRMRPPPCLPTPSRRIAHLVVRPVLGLLERVFDVRAVLVAALGAAREAVLLTGEQPQEGARERNPEPQLPVRV